MPVLVLVLGGVVLALALVVVGAQHRVRVARAQWAADGAAHAAAAEVVPGERTAAWAAADEVARANGARLTALRVVRRGAPPGLGAGAGGDRMIAVSPVVVVEVELGSIGASAAAGRFAVPRR